VQPVHRSAVAQGKSLQFRVAPHSYTMLKTRLG
jgi:hypothetical protein